MTRGDNENNLSIFSRATVPTEEVLSTTGPILQFCSVFLQVTVSGGDKASLSIAQHVSLLQKGLRCQIDCPWHM